MSQRFKEKQDAGVMVYKGSWNDARTKLTVTLTDGSRYVLTPEFLKTHTPQWGTR